jgi:hypothetical protein
MGDKHDTIIAGIGVLILLVLLVVWQTRHLKSGFEGSDPCGPCAPGKRCALEANGLGPAYYACQ